MLYAETSFESCLRRENTPHWRVKEINSTEQRENGLCPLTPREVGIFLKGLGYPTETRIYIAAGEIYGGPERMQDLRSRFPNLMGKVCGRTFIFFVKDLVFLGLA